MADISQPAKPSQLREKRLAALALASKKLIDKGKRRKLEPVEIRIDNFYDWMNNFGLTTRGLMLFMGLSEGDIRSLKEQGFIDYKTVDFKVTSAADAKPLSCLYLTPAGIKEKNRRLREKLTKGLAGKPNAENEVQSQLIFGTPPGITHHSHDLMLSAFIAWLLKRKEITEYLGPAVIRGGALKRIHIQEKYALANKRERNNTWSFDACIMFKGKPLAIEYERTPKKKYLDLQRFFQKFYEHARTGCQLAIVCETEARKTVLKEHLADWRRNGFPMRQVRNGKPVVEPLLLDDEGKTGVRVLAPETLVKLLGHGRKKNGTSSKPDKDKKRTRKPQVPIPSFDDLVKLQDEARNEQRNLAVGLKLDQLLSALKDLDYDNRAISQYQSVTPPMLFEQMIQDSRVQRSERFLVLTDDELMALVGPSSTQTPELIQKLWARGRFFRNLVEAAQPKEEPPERPTPPAEKGFFGKLFGSDD